MDQGQPTSTFQTDEFHKAYGQLTQAGELDLKSFAEASGQALCMAQKMLRLKDDSSWDGDNEYAHLNGLDDRWARVAHSLYTEDKYKTLFNHEVFNAVQDALFRLASHYKSTGNLSAAAKCFEQIAAINFHKLGHLNAVMQLKAVEWRDRYKNSKLATEAKVDVAAKVIETRFELQSSHVRYSDGNRFVRVDLYSNATSKTTQKPGADSRQPGKDARFAQLKASLYELGVYQLQQGHRDKARHYFEQAAALPYSPDTTNRSLYFLYRLTMTKRCILYRNRKAERYLSAMIKVPGKDCGLITSLWFLFQRDAFKNTSGPRFQDLMGLAFCALDGQDVNKVRLVPFLRSVTKELLMRCQCKMDDESYRMLIEKYCNRSQAAEASANQSAKVRVSETNASYFGCRGSADGGLPQVPAMGAGRGFTQA